MRMRVAKGVMLILLLVLGVDLVARKTAGQRRIREQIRQFSELNWICYAPTRYNPQRNTFPTTSDILRDLDVLRTAGFDGIITYECSGVLASIPEIAHHLGFKVIQGVWGPADKKELHLAVTKKNLVVAYCVGNEGLRTRYQLWELDQGVTYISNRTGLPTAISEQVHLYFEEPRLIDLGDWLFPIVHPHFGNAKSLESATRWVEENTARLRSTADRRRPGLTFFAKEIGMPDDGDPSYSEAIQARFLEQMLRSPLRFALFEAFDRKGWEHVSPVEPHWGIFHADRSPKSISVRLPQMLTGRGRPARTAVQLSEER